MIKRDNHFILASVVFFDLLLLIASFLLAHYFTFFDLSLSSWKIKEAIVSTGLIFILFIALENFEFSHSYRFKPFIGLIRSTVYFELFLFSMFYLVKIFNIYEEYHDKFVFYYAAITFSVFFIERSGIKLILTFLRKSGLNYKRFLVVGSGEVGTDFFNMIAESNELGVKIIGFLDDNKDILKSKKTIHTEKIKSLIIGSTDKLETILKTKMIDNVIIAIPMEAVDKIINIFNICENYGVKAELIPRYFKIISDNPSVRKIKKFTLIGVRNVPLENMFNRFIKRLFDISFALFGLFLCFPLFLLIIIIIKLESKGPIFFLQKRTGYNQKEFHIIKFRTMRVNKDSDTRQASKEDPRKTFFGNFLRKTNLDESPQLINILKGDMSLIGPRPHMLAHTEEFTKLYDKYLIRHWVKPGLTGWAQVNGWRGDSDIGIRIKYDLEYIENWSLVFDLKIFFLTFFGKKVKNNAY